MNTKLSVRLVIIKKGKVLLINNLRDDFYYLVGGGVEYGESLVQAAARELREESNMNDIEFEFEKILYIQEMVFENRHKIEVFIKGNTNKFEELEGISDPGHGGDDKLTWVEVNKIPKTFLPGTIAERISSDYAKDFKDINAPLITRFEPER